MKRVFKSLLSIAFLLFALVGNAQVCAPDSLIQKLNDFADAMGQRLNGTVLIARNDTVLVERAFGKRQLFLSGEGYDSIVGANLERYRDDPANVMTPQTLFELASVSKQFTAAAVLKLCSEGKMNLTDYLGKYIPDFPYSGITIRHLLAHTSGLPEYFDFPYDYYDSVRFVNNEHLIRVLNAHRPSKAFPTGTKFSYCNTNYALLAYIVAQVSGLSFEQYVRENLFKPAGMENTFFITEIAGMDSLDFNAPTTDPKAIHVPVPPHLEILSAPLARGHWRSGVRVDYDRLNGILGDKGIYSNVEDMMRWANAFFVEHKIIPEEWVEMAGRRENKLSNGNLPKQIYGYGLRIEESPKHGKLIFHGGLWNGFHNVWIFRPADNVHVIFLSNYYNSAHSGKSDGVFSIIDGLK